MLPRLNPFEYFTDTNGGPLDGGYVYIGTANQNPKTSPITVYLDSDMTIPAPQPLRTTAGRIVKNGSPAAIYSSASTFSILIENKSGQQVAFTAEAESDPASNMVALAASSGSSLVGFIQSGAGAVARTMQDRGREVVSVTDFGADPTGVADSTAAFQAAVDYFQSISNGYASPYVTVKIPAGTYKIAGTNGVEIEYSFDVMQLCFEADAGAKLVGDGSNYAFKFNSVAAPAGGGFRNIFKKLTLEGFGTAIRWHTNNRDQCSLKIVDCESQSNDVFLDTVSYANSRSSLVKIESCFFNDTRVAVNHYTDHMSIKDCWFFAKEGSYDALIYLGGDGAVGIRDSFFIPHPTPLATPANARFIDYFCSGTAADRSVKSLTVSNCRHSLEGVRPFLWFWDYNTGINGDNQVCSITLEDSYFGGTGGNSVVTYKQGYPGSVNLRNCKVLASAEIVSIAAGNTYPPVPSSPSALTYHVIMIDEATRLSQSNTNNAASLVDADLEPFCYDTTTQTSKYKRSFKKNIDYRLPAAAAGAGRVKVSVPVFFDSASSVSSRDIMSFIVVTVSDAGGPGFSNPPYRSQAVTLVSVIGGNSGSTVKRIAATALQDAQGGISFAYANNVSVFWGTGNTGSADIAANSTSGTEDNITIAWDSTTPEVSWAYIIPLAGMRENQQDKMQYGVW